MVLVITFNSRFTPFLLSETQHLEWATTSTSEQFVLAHTKKTL